MISGIHAGISAMQAIQKKTDAAANNVANVESDGYKKIRVTIKEGTPQGVVAETERVNNPGPQVLERTAEGERLVEKSNVELTEEIPSMMLSRRAFQANVKAIQAQDEMLGSLLDIKS